MKIRYNEYVITNNSTYLILYTTVKRNKTQIAESINHS